MHHGEVLHNGFDIPKVKMDASRRVVPQFLTRLESYGDPREISATNEEFDRLVHEAHRFKQLDNSMVFLNSTGQGGGVALMLHAMVRLMSLLDCPVHWHVLLVSHDIFKITKMKFHNVLRCRVWHPRKQ